MAHVKADRVQETTTTTGTGALTLAGATTKFRAFSAALADTDTCVCLIEHASAAEWEVSLCTFASGAGTLTRSTIYASTNGGSAVDFSAGTKTISLLPTASKMVVADNTGATTIPGALLPASNDGGALGSATLSFSDGFFASGALLNFANGNYTITHSSGALSFSGLMMLGSPAAPGARLQLTGNFSRGTWTTSGVSMRSDAATYTDTNGSGTIAERVGSSIAIPTFAASSSVTLTDAATFYIAGPPTAGTNTTITNPWALWIDSGNARFDGSVVSTSATGGVGYMTGAGGTVTQGTSKSTGVTLNKTCGQITMHNANLAADARVSFTVTNSSVATTDVIVANVDSGGTANAYLVYVTAVGAGSFALTVENATGGDLAEAPVISFAVIKGVTS